MLPYLRLLMLPARRLTIEGLRVEEKLVALREVRVGVHWVAYASRGVGLGAGSLVPHRGVVHNHGARIFAGEQMRRIPACLR